MRASDGEGGDHIARTTSSVDVSQFFQVRVPLDPSYLSGGRSFPSLCIVENRSNSEAFIAVGPSSRSFACICFTSYINTGGTRRLQTIH